MLHFGVVLGVRPHYYVLSSVTYYPQRVVAVVAVVDVVAVIAVVAVVAVIVAVSGRRGRLF